MEQESRMDLIYCVLLSCMKMRIKTNVQHLKKLKEHYKLTPLHES